MIEGEKLECLDVELFHDYYFLVKLGYNDLPNIMDSCMALQLRRAS